VTDLFERAEESARRCLDDWDPLALMSVAEANVVTELLAKAIFELPAIVRARACLQDPLEDQGSHQTDFADGERRTMITRFTLLIPVTGNLDLLLRSLPVRGPQTAFFGQLAKVVDDRPPVWELDGSILRLYCNDATDVTRAKEYFNVQLDLIEHLLALIGAETREHNQRMADLIPRAVAQRQAELLADRDHYASIGFPITQRADAGAYHVPITRKKITLARSAASAASNRYAPEPFLADADYEAVLDVIHSARNALERAPSTTSKLEEPEIRDLLLVLLNAHFEGKAAGEVFNGSGKTDILIRDGDHNVFIGECKIITQKSGAKSVVTHALNQLLGYLTPRDTKAALLLLIRDRDVSAVVGQAFQEIRRHPNYKRTGSITSDERYDLVIHANGDKNREIRLACLPFLIAAKQPKDGPGQTAP
jgi:hypothetical protein